MKFRKPVSQVQGFGREKKSFRIPKTEEKPTSREKRVGATNPRGFMGKGDPRGKALGQAGVWGAGEKQA